MECQTAPEDTTSSSISCLKHMERFFFGGGGGESFLWRRNRTRRYFLFETWSGFFSAVVFETWSGFFFGGGGSESFLLDSAKKKKQIEDAESYREFTVCEIIKIVTTLVRNKNVQ